jgi:hypothetical protein
MIQAQVLALSITKESLRRLVKQCVPAVRAESSPHAVVDALRYLESCGGVSNVASQSQS